MQFQAKIRITACVQGIYCGVGSGQMRGQPYVVSILRVGLRGRLISTTRVTEIVPRNGMTPIVLVPSIICLMPPRAHCLVVMRYGKIKYLLMNLLFKPDFLELHDTLDSNCHAVGVRSICNLLSRRATFEFTY